MILISFSIPILLSHKSFYRFIEIIDFQCAVWTNTGFLFCRYDHYTVSHIKRGHWWFRKINDNGFIFEVLFLNCSSIWRLLTWKHSNDNRAKKFTHHWIRLAFNRFKISLNCFKWCERICDNTPNIYIYIY